MNQTTVPKFLGRSLALSLALVLGAGCSPTKNDADSTAAGKQKIKASCLVTPDEKLSRFHHAAKCVQRMADDRACSSQASIAACLSAHQGYDAKQTAQYLDHLVATGMIAFDR